MTATLAETVAGKRLNIVAALSARFRDLDLAEEAFAEACLRAASQEGEIADWAAWLFTTANRYALDRIRHRKVAESFAAQTIQHDEASMEQANSIPDHRLALLFACCHPAIDLSSRVALALTTICGLTVDQVAKATLLGTPALAQRIARAKRKLAGGGIVFEIPDPRFYRDRLEAVLTTIEMAYSRAHGTGAGDGERALLARQTLSLSALLVEMLPDEGDVLALAASLHFSEARRSARVDADGRMVPLDRQDPARWDRDLLVRALEFRSKTPRLADKSPRRVQMELQHCWCSRRASDAPAQWSPILALYDRLLDLEESAFARLNRLVALRDVRGPATLL